MGKSSEVGYILSLGVHKNHRRNGIGSLLLDSLINHLTTIERARVKAIFLHVLTTNQPAILFYEKRRYIDDRCSMFVLPFKINYFLSHLRFRMNNFLPYYYSIKGICRDGFTYVLYINGGHPPWSIIGNFTLNLFKLENVIMVDNASECLKFNLLHRSCKKSMF